MKLRLVILNMLYVLINLTDICKSGRAGAQPPQSRGWGHYALWGGIWAVHSQENHSHHVSYRARQTL